MFTNRPIASDGYQLSEAIGLLVNILYPQNSHFSNRANWIIMSVDSGKGSIGNGEGRVMVWHENTQVGEFRLRERQFHGAARDSWLAETVGTGDAVRLASMELPPHLEPLREQAVAPIRSSLAQFCRLRKIGVVPRALHVRAEELLTLAPH